MATRYGLDFYFIAMGAAGKGLSGGDRIFIELARRWSKKCRVTVFTWEQGREMCRRQKLYGEKLEIRNWRLGVFCRFGFVACYLARIIKAIVEASKLIISNRSSTIVYSASEFWMDSLPAFILKLRNPQITWAAAWYQTAPNPLQGFKEGARESGYRLFVLLYWLAQLPIKPLIKRYADFVLINNEDERKQFPGLDKKGRAIILLGAVDLKKIRDWKTVFQRNLAKRAIRNLPEVFDAVFQGRFHPQKGVVELIDIWKRVVEKIPGAQLAMIGDGPLRKKVELRIKSYGLSKNVNLFGYLFDGSRKYDIFRRSKLVVHPAFYDSGGMASAEAMAFGRPCVSFNLKAYQSYYPQGMIKVKIGDLDAFAGEIIGLLGDKNYRGQKGKEALEMIEKNWSWDKRAEEVFERIVEVVDKG